MFLMLPHQTLFSVCAVNHAQAHKLRDLRVASRKLPFVLSELSKLPKLFAAVLLYCAASNFTGSFKLEVDASALGVGAVLLQEDEHGIDYPICFFSKKLIKH